MQATALEDIGRDGQQLELNIATTQENAVSRHQENALVSQVAQQGIVALQARLAKATATSLQKLSIPEGSLRNKR